MLVVVLLAAANASCGGDDEASPGLTELPGTTTVEPTTTPASPGSTTELPSPTTGAPTTTAAPVSGEAGPGWVTPARGDRLCTQPLDIIQAQMGVTGHQSPDWRAFLGESDEPRAVEGLPGTWFGIEYDFVSGEAGDTPGLPDEVVRCLDGT